MWFLCSPGWTCFIIFVICAVDLVCVHLRLEKCPRSISFLFRLFKWVDSCLFLSELWISFVSDNQLRKYLILAVQIPNDIWNKLGKKKKVASASKNGKVCQNKAFCSNTLLQVLIMLRLCIKSNDPKPGCVFPLCLIQTLVLNMLHSWFVLFEILSFVSVPRCISN